MQAIGNTAAVIGERIRRQPILQRAFSSSAPNTSRGSMKWICSGKITPVEIMRYVCTYQGYPLFRNPAEIPLMVS